jgi:hypothetical protein
LGTLQLQPKEVLTGFEVVLLFTKVQIRETLNIPSQNFDEYNVRLSRYVLTFLFFCIRYANKRIRQF